MKLDVVAATCRHLGTPHHHQAVLAGAGYDCLGLVRGVWRDLCGAEPETPLPYTLDCGETERAEPLLTAAWRHLVEIDIAAAEADDVFLFRMARGSIIKHCAILVGEERMVHAVSRDQVREMPYDGWWHGRTVAAFVFPKRGDGP